MSIRECCFPACCHNISELPKDHVLCTDHKIKLEVFALNLRKWLNGRVLPDKDIMFVFLHPKGCNGNELMVQMGKNKINSAVTYGVSKGHIKAKKTERNWLIDQDEIIRLLDIYRNWISIGQVARLSGYDKDALRQYALGGHLGTTCLNMSGAISITNDVFEQFDRLIPQIRNYKEESRTSWSSRNISPTELSLTKLCSEYGEFGIQRGIIKHWINRRLLPFYKKGKILVIRRRDFQKFAIAVSNGQHALRKYASIMQTICIAEDWI